MKLINRPHYLNQLSGVMNTPDIKIVTGIRRSGKSKLLSAFARYIRSIDSTANVIEIDLTKLRFEKLKESRTRLTRFFLRNIPPLYEVGIFRRIFIRV